MGIAGLKEKAGRIVDDDGALFVLRAECRNPKNLGRRWAFDLAYPGDEGVDVIACEIGESEAARIGGYLSREGRSLHSAITEGTMLQVQGSLALDWRSSLILSVKRIDPGFASQPDGLLHRQDLRTLGTLAESPAPRQRVHGKAIHCTAGDRPPWPTPLRKVLVIAPQGKGLSDFEGEVSRLGPRLAIEYATISGSGPKAAQRLASLVRGAPAGGYDLVLVVRGGGSWADLRLFDDPDIACAIAHSSVPVATAIGHRDDTTMADRAARFSFITPTAAGKTLASEVWSRAGRPKKPGPSPAAPSTPAAADASYQALVKARKEAQGMRAYARDALRAHIGDLLELAGRRVALVSRCVSVLTLLACAATLVLIPAVDTSGMPVLHVIAVAATGIVLLWGQGRARKRRHLPAVKDMRRPPASVDEWRALAKRAVTVGQLRALRRHIP